MEKSIHPHLFDSAATLREHRMIGFANPLDIKTRTVEDKPKELVDRVMTEGPAAEGRAKVDTVVKATASVPQSKETQKKLDMFDKQKEAFEKEKVDAKKTYDVLNAQARDPKMTWKEWGEKAQPEVKRLYSVMKKFTEENPVDNERVKFAADAIQKIIDLSEISPQAKASDALGIYAKEAKDRATMKLKGTALDRGDEFVQTVAKLDSAIADYNKSKEKDPRNAELKLQTVKDDLLKGLDTQIAEFANPQRTKPVDAPQQINVVIMGKKTIESKYRKALMPEVKVVPAAKPAEAAKVGAVAPESKGEKMEADKLMQWEKDAVKDLAKSIVDKDEPLQKSILEYWTSNPSFKNLADLLNREKLINEELKKDPTMTKHVELRRDKLVVVDNKVEAPVTAPKISEKQKTGLEQFMAFLEEFFRMISKLGTKLGDVGSMKDHMGILNADIALLKESQKGLSPDSKEYKENAEKLKKLEKEKIDLESSIKQAEAGQKRLDQASTQITQTCQQAGVPICATAPATGPHCGSICVTAPNCTPAQADGYFVYIRNHVKQGTIVDTPRIINGTPATFITKLGDDNRVIMNGDVKGNNNNIGNRSKGDQTFNSEAPARDTRPNYTVKRNNVDYRPSSANTRRLYDLNRTNPNN